MSQDTLFFGLSILQCALLHPRWQHYRSAHWIRLFLGPLTVWWWLCYPFRSPLPPIQQRVFRGFLAAHMVFKYLEWTFATGPYYLRNSKIIDGVPNWKNEPPPGASSERFDLGELVLWTTLSFTAQRGLRWSWGETGKGNTASLGGSLLEMIRLQLVTLSCIAFLVSSQENLNRRVDPKSVLLKLGCRKFLGLNLIAECVHSICAGILMVSGIEMAYLMRVILAYFLYSLAKMIGVPSRFSQVLNPANYPPQFGAIFDLYSVSHFWSKTWHQLFRRPLLFCAGKPAMTLARYMGASLDMQKIFGDIASFTLSGILHEYYKTVISIIPKRLGGGRLWTLSFLLLTAPLFTRDFGRPGGIKVNFDPLSQWKWSDYHIPIALKSLISPSQNLYL